MSAFHHDEIQQDITEFLQARTTLDAAELKETDLIAGGVLDSLALMDLVAHLESRFQIQLDGREMSPRNFDRVESITRCVSAHFDSAGSEPLAAPAN